MKKPLSLSAHYRAVSEQLGACAIEAGFIGRNADNECPCPAGRLPNDATPPCGCWPIEWETRHHAPDLLGVLAEDLAASEKAAAKVTRLVPATVSSTAMIAFICQAIDALGKVPTIAEYDALASERGWPAAPRHGWRNLRVQARLQAGRKPARATA